MHHYHSKKKKRRFRNKFGDFYWSLVGMWFHHSKWWLPAKPKNWGRTGSWVKSYKTAKRRQNALRKHYLHIKKIRGYL